MKVFPEKFIPEPAQFNINTRLIIHSNAQNILNLHIFQQSHDAFSSPSYKECLF